MTANCWIGDDKHTKSGNAFKLVAITRDEGPLEQNRYVNLPSHRKRSKEVTLIRQ
jgi:hypothetical protein